MIRFWVLILVHMGNGGDFLEVATYQRQDSCESAKALVLDQMNRGGYLVKAACVPKEH